MRLDEVLLGEAALFDRKAEHRPCGLLDRLGAAGMLLGDVLGLPLLPWELAEPVGKAASKLKKKIPEKRKEAKKRAKRSGGDPEAECHGPHAGDGLGMGGCRSPMPRTPLGFRLNTMCRPAR